MKTLNVPFDDREHQELEAKKKKLKLSWKEFILSLLGERNGKSKKH